MTLDTLRTRHEAELLSRVAGGDDDALGELYDRHAPVLLALARRILGDPADAEEVLQEAFVHAWNRAARYDPARSSVATWLALITRSRAIDRLRSRKVVERTAEAAGHEAPRHESPSAAGAVLQDERRARIAAALAGLPEEQRQVLEMAYYRGMSQTEIARAAEIPLGTVKTRTLLAMKKLRDELRDEIEELL